MSDTNCPYCGAEIEINHDDGEGYDEDKIHQQECHECEKTFTFTTMIHFTYSPEKAACLNGGEHQYRLTMTHPPQFAKLRCVACGDEKEPSPVEKAKVGR